MSESAEAVNINVRIVVGESEFTSQNESLSDDSKTEILKLCINKEPCTFSQWKSALQDKGIVLAYTLSKAIESAYDSSTEYFLKKYNSCS